MHERHLPRHAVNATTWTRASYGAALVLTASIGYFLLHLPIELSENMLAILIAQHTSLATVFTFTHGDVIRPLGWVLFKVVLGASSDHAFEGFRVLNTLTLAGIFVLGIHLMRVRTAQAWASAMLSLMVMAGMSSFHEAIRETAVNHHIIVPMFLFAAVSVAMAPRKWWSDPLAVLLLVCALLLVEAGVLVWVALAVCWLTGMRGVSTRGVLVCTALLAGYLVLRMVLLTSGMPAFGSRSTGFGFHAMDQAEIHARFGAHPLWLYAYNILSAAMLVAASEPRGGAFVATDQILHGSLRAGSVINVLTSTLTTGMLVWYAAGRAKAWVAREFTHGDRLFLVGVAVWAANAVVSFSYLKDVVMTTGSLACALAVFPACVRVLEQFQRPTLTFARATLVSALIMLISVGWTVRAALLFVDVRVAAYKAQEDWAETDRWLAEQKTTLSDADHAVVVQWRNAMLAKPVPRLYLSPAWLVGLDQD